MTAVRVGTHTLEVSRPDKVLFPGDGITKGDVVDYYRRIADRMLPHLRGRPLALRRWPNGIASHGFFQKEVSSHFPDWIDRATLERERGGTVTHVVCNDAATLVYLADQAVIELHRLLGTAAAPRVPVELILDLDPPGGETALVPHAARVLRGLLSERHVTGFVKSTGSKGVHVHIPLDGADGFATVRTVARDLARELVRRDPERLTIEHRKDRRGDRLFVDWLRNSYGQHAIAPYSLRGRPGAPVAVPLDWDEAVAADFDPQRYRITNIFRRLGRKRDPWEAIHEVRFPIGALATPGVV